MPLRAAPVARPRFFRRHPMATLLGFVILVVLAGAVIDVVRIRSEVEAGKATLEGLTLQDVRAGGGIGGTTAQLQRRLHDADRRAHDSPWLRVLAPVPVLGDQVRGLRDLSGVLAGLSDTARASGTSIDRALERSGTPSGRLRLLDVTRDELDSIEDALVVADQRIEDISTSGLLPQLAAAHTATADAVASALAKVEDGKAMVETARSLLSGPNRYLVLAANNAEMTAGSGMPLSVGVADLSDGEIELGTFTPSSEFLLGKRRVDVPGDLGSLYALMGIGGDFRGTTATPNFPTAARIASEMASRTRLGEVDGVMLIDVIALQGLIGATGPVTVDGVEYTQENVAEELLNRNYVRYGEIASEERDRRTDLQARVASAVFDALTTRDVELTDLLMGVQDAAIGRHLLAWSPDEDVEEIWTRLGVTGELHPLGLMISVENYDGNKLDWYIRPTAQMQVDRTVDGDWRVRLGVTVSNPALDPAEVGDVIIGRDPRYHWVLLDLHLPRDAYDITTTDPDGFTAKGKDQPMVARTLMYPIRRGGTETRTIQFSLPREDLGMILLPSARVAPLRLTVDDTTTVTDARPTGFTWTEARADQGSRSSPARAIVLVALTMLLGATVCLAYPVTRSGGFRRELSLVERRLLASSQLLAVLVLASLVVAAVVAIVDRLANPPL